MPTVTVSRRLPYSAEQIFALVADVERYPEFLPWWVAAKVQKREPQAYETDQVIRFGVVRQRFSSRTILEPHRRISVTATGSSLRRLELDWWFEALPDDGAEVRLRALRRAKVLVRGGAGTGNRTPDLFITSESLCRLSYPGGRARRRAGGRRRQW